MNPHRGLNSETRTNVGRSVRVVPCGRVFIDPLMFCVFCLFQPQNILLTSAQPLGDIRIVDFGLSRHMDDKTEVREILGTPEYTGESLGFICFGFICSANEGHKEVQIRTGLSDRTLKPRCSISKAHMYETAETVKSPFGNLQFAAR